MDNLLYIISLLKQKLALLMASLALMTGNLGGISITSPQMILSKIEISQQQYFQKNGRYWQGLSTNDLNIKPEYQKEKWGDLISLSPKLPFEIIVNQYEAPKKQFGYQVIFKLNDGKIQSYGYGIEAKDLTYSIIPKINIATTTIR